MAILVEEQHNIGRGDLEVIIAIQEELWGILMEIHFIVLTMGMYTQKQKMEQVQQQVE